MFTILSAEPSPCLTERGYHAVTPPGSWWDLGPEKLLDPTGDDDRAVDTTLAPRLSSLRGLTAGLLENTKPNASAFLSAVGRELLSRHGLRATVLYTKSYFGTPAEESLIQRILHNCDFAVAGIGD